MLVWFCLLRLWFCFGWENFRLWQRDFIFRKIKMDLLRIWFNALFMLSNIWFGKNMYFMIPLFGALFVLFYLVSTFCWLFAICFIADRKEITIIYTPDVLWYFQIFWFKMRWIALENLDAIHLQESLLLDREMCSNKFEHDGEQY